MSAKQLIVISVLVIIIIVAIYFAFFRTPVVGNSADKGSGGSKETPPGPSVGNVTVTVKPPTGITGGTNTINLTGKGVYAAKDGVNVYSIYDSHVLKTVNKGVWIGTYNGLWGAGNSASVNTSSGKGFVSNGLYTVK